MYLTRRIRPIRKNGNAYQKPYRMLSMIPPPMHSTTRANLRYIFIENMYFAFAAKIVEIYFIVQFISKRFSGFKLPPPNKFVSNIAVLDRRLLLQGNQVMWNVSGLDPGMPVISIRWVSDQMRQEFIWPLLRDWKKGRFSGYMILKGRYWVLGIFLSRT